MQGKEIDWKFLFERKKNRVNKKGKSKDKGKLCLSSLTSTFQ